MKKFDVSALTLKPLSIDDLRKIIGGDGDAVTPDDLLGTNGLITEDLTEGL